MLTGYFGWCNYLCFSPNNFQLTLLGIGGKKISCFYLFENVLGEVAFLKLPDKIDFIGSDHSHVSQRQHDTRGKHIL